MWIDVAAIMFSCVTANHLGLISAIEDVIRHKLWIIDCPKCFTFWTVLLYGLYDGRECFTVVAISFLASYIAIWLELLEGYVDSIYMKAYEKIYADTDNDTSATTADGVNTTSPMS